VLLFRLHYLLQNPKEKKEKKRKIAMNRSLTFGVSRPDPNAKPDISSFQRWMVALCAIRFDLQQGQVRFLISHSL
jgi:hypothetical protein